MFVQVILGRVAEPGRMRERLDAWHRDLAGDAAGWLGSTAGVTREGRFVALARFETEEAARRNSDRPEQGEWWADTAQLFEEEATFLDSTDVEVDLVGDPDRAGFVQVIRGRTSDPRRARELMADDGTFARWRPDVLGSLTAGHPDGGYTVAIYFTSEAEAREGERKEPPAELAERMAEMGRLEVGEPEFLDLPDPWLYTPGRAPGA